MGMLPLALPIAHILQPFGRAVESIRRPGVRGRRLDPEPVKHLGGIAVGAAGQVWHVLGEVDVRGLSYRKR